MNLATTIRNALLRWLLPPEAYYEATRHTIRRSYLPGAGLQSARFDVNASSLYTLRAKARYFEKNSPIVNKLADLWEQYTVGQGLVAQPASSDEEWNAAAAEWWAYWSELPDVASRQNLGTLLAMVSRAWFVDGELFLLQARGDTGMPRLQCIEAHLVRTPKELEQTEDIIDGIRVDTRTLRPLAYFVHTEKGKSREATWEEVEARFVMHHFEPARPGQLRGLPLLHPALNTLHDLDDLHLLEMSAAKDAAKTSKVIKRAAGNEFNAATLAAARITGTLPTANGGSVETSRVAYYDDAVGEGRVILQPGDDYQQFSSERPSVVTREYWRYLTEQVCAAVGIPYVLVFPDSMQGTVYRGALDSAAAFFACRSAVMQSLVARIYQYAMGWARYTQPTLLDAPADWKRIRISPPRAVNVDVGRNSQALLAEIGAGVSTFSRAYASLGLDAKAELRVRAQEAAYIRELAEEFGLDVSEVSILLRERSQSAATPPAQPQPDEDEEDEEEDEQTEAETEKTNA
jgi:lambda family phage portal protein